MAMPSIGEREVKCIQRATEETSVNVQTRPARQDAVLHDLFARNPIGQDVATAWSGLKQTLLDIAKEVSARNVLEIGAGRHPFLIDEADQHGFELTINDIDANELDYAPVGPRRLIFDISSTIDDTEIPRGQFDLVFSRMVFEHVPDARRAWNNLFELLAPGGVGFAFVPTLFSPPFVINRLIPEAVSSRLLYSLDRTRTIAEIPKFPAFYDYCRASEKALQPMLEEIGYREVLVLPFFGTPYFPRIPVLRHAAKMLDNIAEKRDWRIFASYAYIMARR